MTRMLFKALCGLGVRGVFWEQRQVLASFLLVMEMEEGRPALCVGCSGTVFNVVLTTAWIEALFISQMKNRPSEIVGSLNS